MRYSRLLGGLVLASGSGDTPNASLFDNVTVLP